MFLFPDQNNDHLFARSPSLGREPTEMHAYVFALVQQQCSLKVYSIIYSDNRSHRNSKHLSEQPDNFIQLINFNFDFNSYDVKYNVKYSWQIEMIVLSQT